MKLSRLSLTLILIGFVLLLSGVSGSAEQQQQTPSGLQKVSAYCANPPNNKEEEWLHKFLCDVRATDIAVAAFSGLLVLVTVGLIVVGLWQIHHMRQTAQSQLRAYLSVDPEITCLENGKQLTVRVRTTNYGQTPAYDLIVKSGMGAGASFDTLSAPTPPSPGETTKATIPPKGKNDHFHSTPFLISSEIISDLQAGRGAIWVYGEINYIDAFKNPRFKKYRFMIGASPGVHGKSMAICEEGNEEN